MVFEIQRFHAIPKKRASSFKKGVEPYGHKIFNADFWKCTNAERPQHTDSSVYGPDRRMFIESPVYGTKCFS